MTARLLRSLTLCLAALLSAPLAGCSSSTLTIEVESSETTNDKRSFYLVARTLDERNYVTDSYEDIANRVFKNPPDPSILKAVPVLPGHDLEVEVKKPEDKALAIYFLFTDPGPRWKTLLDRPLPNTVQFRLDTNQIAEQD